MKNKSSYAWWQENGAGWIDEIRSRKSNLIYYHIEELLLLNYFERSNFSRVLEFGCGFGRHLHYLREIPNLEVFGYDQSESITGSILKWAEAEWVAQYIKVGEPNSSLPYPDQYFDAVFTTSVLIHIPPEDVVGVIKELIRVAKYQIIHQEPAPDYEVFQEAKEGWWHHDLMEIYRSINQSCEVLEPSGEIQRIYKVLINSKAEGLYTPSNTFLRKVYDFEKFIQPTVNSLTVERNDLAQQRDRLTLERDELAQQRDRVTLERNHLVHQCDRLTVERNHLVHQCDRLTVERNHLVQQRDRLTLERDELVQQRDRLTLERDELVQQRDRLTLERDELVQQRDRLTLERNELAQQLDYRTVELSEIINSRTWKAILRIKSNWQLKSAGRLALNLLQGVKRVKKHQSVVSVEVPSVSLSNIPFTDSEMENWLKSFTQQGKAVLAVYVTNWLGINFATKNMFEDCYPIAEHLTEEQAKYYANLLLTAGVKHLISAGAAPGHLEVIKALNRSNSGIRCDVTWHGSYVQHYEDYGWSMMTQAITLAKQRMIYKFGFAKKGMEKTFQAIDLRAEFLPNFVNLIPDSASVVTSNNPQLGIWLSWIGYRKLPYPMIAAAQLVEGSVLNMAGVENRAKQWADMLGVKVNYFSPGPIPREELHQRIKNTHLSLYLTSSECAPMLPIESLSLGVPCLISPVSHWFEDDEYLHSRLVVPYPERPEIIADYIKQALDEREQIIDRFKSYATRYNSWAIEQVQKFLRD
jgi:SAM-dependent methyltransferase